MEIQVSLKTTNTYTYPNYGDVTEPLIIALCVTPDTTVGELAEKVLNSKIYASNPDTSHIEIRIAKTI